MGIVADLIQEGIRIGFDNTIIHKGWIILFFNYYLYITFYGSTLILKKLTFCDYYGTVFHNSIFYGKASQYHCSGLVPSIPDVPGALGLIAAIAPCSPLFLLLGVRLLPKKADS